MKHQFTVLLAALAAAGQACAGVAPDEAKKLGSTLTAVGAEKEANKDGTIPEFTGGITTPPANYTKGSGTRPEPFAAEKPRLVLTGKNLAGQENHLTAGEKELLKRFPNFRMDVYPTHRTVTFPKFILDNTARNAVAARSVAGGLGVEGALAGVPFPLPKTGNEVMWNHLLRYQGLSFYSKFDSWNVDSSGAATLATTGEIWEEFPLSDPRHAEPAKQGDAYFRTKLIYTAPARRVGEALIGIDAVNPIVQPRRVWQYLPGQRRVKQAPDVAYDTPDPGSAGASTYDDGWIFNGAMDRFDFKLTGKKEIIVPYNAYRLANVVNPAELTKPNFLNPDLARWELHRVWVVEATLKPGKRHIYSRRTFYIDEDSWVAMASDEYDARGQLYRSSFDNLTFSYDVLAPQSGNHVVYDFVAGSYNVRGLSGPHGGVKYVAPLKSSEWTPDSLAGSGVR